ncbi:MAG: SDR family oxidoreductase [Pirellulaceae bacterium]|jgi:NAD(P)-dependent dehydrogenase (short-subunit alcohol dehydrogenase family)
MTKLSGQVIIVTGGTQGIGEAVALHAAQAGAAGVVITGRNRERGQNVASQVDTAGTEALFVPADLGNVDECRNIVHQCNERFGRVDGLVNAAANTSRGTLEETSVEFWDLLFAINVRAPFLLIQEAARIMQRDNIAGSIVNILSVAAYCGQDNLVAYSSTKGALRTLTKNTANGLRQHRIRVNGINLGWTDTPAEHAVQGEQGSPLDWLKTAESASPFGRLIKPDDVARLCMYLLSTDSGILTGSTIDYTQRVMGVYPPDTGRS